MLWRRSGSCVVALPRGADECVLLDGVGAVIWDRLDAPATSEELVQELATAFPDEPVARIHADTGRFLDQLQASRIVTCV